MIGTGFGRTGTLSLKRALEDLAQGWEPLCGFLDLPVPDHPFPHLNDTAAMRRRIGAVHVGRRALPAVAGMGVALATSGAVRHRRAPR